MSEGSTDLLRCHDLSDAIALFQKLGYRIDLISPADEPTAAAMSGPTGNVMLTTLTEGVPRMGGELVIPDGAAAFVHTPATQNWGVGRASMLYRDLLPDRQGGRFIASHIQITDGGPVPDYVHFHDIRFQMIFVHRGWVRLVYEDQGEPFVLEAGDCVLQPPLIRHRVLESSAGLEVVEVGCPAVHDTHAEHQIELPTGKVLPHRDFGGQRFVRSNAAATPFAPEGAAVTTRDTGIGSATGGLAGASVTRFPGPIDNLPITADEFRLWFVREGHATILPPAVNGLESAAIQLGPSDAVSFSAEPAHLTSRSEDFEVLEVTLPG